MNNSVCCILPYPYLLLIEDVACCYQMMGETGSNHSGKQLVIGIKSLKKFQPLDPLILLPKFYPKK